VCPQQIDKRKDYLTSGQFRVRMATTHDLYLTLTLSNHQLSYSNAL